MQHTRSIINAQHWKQIVRFVFFFLFSFLVSFILHPQSKCCWLREETGLFIFIEHLAQNVPHRLWCGNWFEKKFAQSSIPANQLDNLKLNSHIKLQLKKESISVLLQQTLEWSDKGSSKPWLFFNMKHAQRYIQQDNASTHLRLHNCCLKTNKSYTITS